MRRVGSFAAFLLIAATGAAMSQAPGAPAGAPPPANRPPPFSFINLPFEDGGVIPDQYTAKATPQPAGSLPLFWTNVPAGTQSFALIMHDVDVVANRSMTDNLHWLIFNIPATSTSLPASVPNVAMLPDGSVQPKNRTSNGYGGPGYPGPGYHHYSIELFALDTKLALTDTATRDDVVKASEGHVLGKAVLAGRFHR